MSNALIALVPVLDSTNYHNWKRSMEAYLKSQDLWNVTTVKVRQDLVLDVSKSGSIGATKQDLIKIKSRSSGKSCSTSPH
jgi:Domain of unknown function (DUF4219)